MKNNSAGNEPPPIADQGTLFNRRQWLQGSFALILAGLAGSTTLSALAASSKTDGFDTFLTLSKALTARHVLNTEIGQRLFMALQHHNPLFSNQLQTLSHAITSGVLSTEQQAQALQILQAWYLGTVNNQVITYEHALMFEVAADVLIIRSYCPDKPGFWAEKPVISAVPA